MRYEDGYSDGGVSDASALLGSVAMGLAAFGVGLIVFLAALIFFRWAF